MWVTKQVIYVTYILTNLYKILKPRAIPNTDRE